MEALHGRVEIDQSDGNAGDAPDRQRQLVAGILDEPALLHVDIKRIGENVNGIEPDCLGLFQAKPRPFAGLGEGGVDQSEIHHRTISLPAINGIPFPEEAYQPTGPALATGRAAAAPDRIEAPGRTPPGHKPCRERLADPTAHPGPLRAMGPESLAIFDPSGLAKTRADAAALWTDAPDSHAPAVPQQVRIRCRPLASQSR